METEVIQGREEGRPRAEPGAPPALVRKGHPAQGTEREQAGQKQSEVSGVMKPIQSISRGPASPHPGPSYYIIVLYSPRVLVTLR